MGFNSDLVNYLLYIPLLYSIIYLKNNMKKHRPLLMRENYVVLSPIWKRVQRREYGIKDHHVAVQSRQCLNVILMQKVDDVSKHGACNRIKFLHFFFFYTFLHKQDMKLLSGQQLYMFKGNVKILVWSFSFSKGKSFH